MMAPESLQEAAELVQKYVQSCVDNRTKYADYSTFGGRVHVATITPDGFNWVVPPSDLNNNLCK
jgi:hypothetical protein